MEAEIGVKQFRAGLDAVLALVDEARFFVSKDNGLEIKAINQPPHVLVSAKFSPTAFNFFELEEGIFAVDLKELNEVLKIAETGKSVSFGMQTDQIGLDIDIGGITCRLNFIDMSVLHVLPRMPDFETPVSLSVRGSQLKKAIKLMDKVGETGKINIGLGKETLYLEDTKEENPFNLRIPAEIINTGKSRSCFDLDYLTDITKNLGKIKEVRLDIGVDVPLRVSYSPYPGIEIEYVLAPRIGKK